MILVVSVILLVIAAASFAVWPVLRAGRGRGLLGGAIVLFVIAIGGGTYVLLGRPELALRASRGANTQDLGSLVTPLVQHLHKVPGDMRGWTMLGRVYLTVNDPEDAAKALARAVTISRASGKPSAELYSTYGEAVVRLSSGTVPPEAQSAFEQALLLDPKDSAARYFLGFAYAARGENAKAIALWQSLLNDAPATAPYRRGTGRPHRDTRRVVRRSAGCFCDGRRSCRTAESKSQRCARMAASCSGLRGAWRQGEGCRCSGGCARSDEERMRRRWLHSRRKQKLSSWRSRGQFFWRPCHTGQHVACPAFLALS